MWEKKYSCQIENKENNRKGWEKLNELNVPRPN